MTEHISVQLTEFQKKKIVRDKQIVADFKQMKGARTACFESLARKYNLTLGRINQIILKEGL